MEPLEFVQTMANDYCVRFLDGMPNVPILLAENRNCHPTFQPALESEPRYIAVGESLLGQQHWNFFRNKFKIALIDAWLNWRKQSREEVWFFWKAKAMGVDVTEYLDKYGYQEKTKLAYQYIQEGRDPHDDVFFKEPFTTSYTPSYRPPYPPPNNPLAPKVCPQCKATEDDAALSFCLYDGTPLVLR